VEAGDRGEGATASSRSDVADRAVAAYIARQEARADGSRSKSRWTWTVSLMSTRLQVAS
jgi:hypothetical protein